MTEKYNIKRILIGIVILSGITVLPAKSQNDSIDYLYAVTDTLDDDIILFDKDDPLEITLAFDITRYRRNMQKDEYLDAILTYHISAADSVVRKLKVRPRGISRRSICNFPPLMLNFRKQVFIDALKEYNEKKEEFYKPINEFPYLNAKSKKKMINYLKTFYKGFNKRNTIVNILRGECIDF